MSPPTSGVFTSSPEIIAFIHYSTLLAADLRHIEVFLWNSSNSEADIKATFIDERDVPSHDLLTINGMSYSKSGIDWKL